MDEAKKTIGLKGWLAIVLVTVGAWFWFSYNSFVNLNENAKTAQADVEVQYQRRFDLIPNLVKAVEGIFNQERAVFESITEARTKYAGAPAGTPQRLEAINQVESALGRLLAVVENYPNLRSSESVQKLQDQLEGTENRISVARNNFNAFVNTLNKKIRSFPSNLIARLFNFEEMHRFESAPTAHQAPAVEFKTNP